MTRAVTEQDFRMPEFRDAKVEDYELRSDGKVVRKDRWETAVHSIRNLVGPAGREFEIADVVARVRVLDQFYDEAMEAVGDNIWAWLREPFTLVQQTEASTS